MITIIIIILIFTFDSFIEYWLGASKENSILNLKRDNYEKHFLLSLFFTTIVYS